MTTPRTRTEWGVVGLIAVGVVVVLGWLYRGATTRPDLLALVAQDGVDWIVYPRERWFRHMRVCRMDTTFERNVVLASAPQTAPLEIRAFRHCVVLVNGMLAHASDLDNEDWKRTDSVDIAPLLKAGDNELRVIAYNDDAPPAMWFRLDLGDRLVVSDGSWQSVYSEAPPRAAISAAAKRGTQKRPQGGPKTTTAFGNQLPVLGLLLLLSGGAWFAAQLVLRKRGVTSIGPRFAIGLVAVAAVLLLARFANNVPNLSHWVGFDARAHEAYIGLIQSEGGLPDPRAGVQTHQPPLYYLLNATLGGVLGIDIRANTGEGTGFARFLSQLLGIAQLAFLFGSLRLLLPGKPLAQFAGLVFVAFLPMHAFIYHYISNETLNGTMAAATLYVLLRIVVGGKTSVLSYAAVGVCLGAALLSKISGFLLVPVVFVALAAKLWSDRTAPIGWVKTIGLTGVLTVAVAGWHYIPVYLEEGTLFIRRIDEVADNQWKNPGYHTFASILRWGDSLTYPTFSGFDSLPDALYSTFWGDGRMGGSVGHDVAPPWNYELMAANYLLGLLPMALIAIGFVLGTIRFFTKPTVPLFCLLALVFGMAVALVREQLHHPHVITAKAWYAIPILTSLAALCAFGFDWIARFRPWAAVALTIALGWWGVTSYASFWIRTGSPEVPLNLANEQLKRNQPKNAIAILNEALKIDPNHVGSLIAMSAALRKQKRMPEARALADRALAIDSGDPNVLFEAAQTRDPRTEAVGRHELLMEAIRRAPDFLEAMEVATDGLRRSRQPGPEAQLTREILRVRPRNRNLPREYANLARACLDLNAHLDAVRVSLYAMEAGRYTDGRARDTTKTVFSRVAGPRRGRSTIPAEQAEAMRLVAWFASVHFEKRVRDLFDPLPIAERLAAATQRKDPAILAALAAAYANAGRLDEATTAAREALALPGVDERRPLYWLTREALGAFANGQPLRMPRWSPGMIWWCAQR